jgi:hypothetical protein
MRVSVFNRPQTWRRVVAAASAAVLVMSIAGVAVVTGANTRLAYVGSPPAPVTAPDPTSVGLLTFTPVTAGGQTKVDYLVHSYDNQSLTHAFLDLPSTTVPQPSGLTVDAVYGTDAGACTWVKGGPNVSCDFVKLTPKKADRSISVVWAVSPTFDASQTPVFTASLQVNEQTNPNGTNVQVYQANSGAATVTPGDANLVDTFLAPGEGGPIFTAGLGTAGAGNLQTMINVPAIASGGKVHVADESNAAVPFACPSGYVCQDDYATALVNDGTVSPFLEWTLTATVPSTYKLQQAFVAHYKNDGSLDVLLLNKQKDACTTPTKVPCATFSQAGDVVTIYVRTKSNGGMRY